jgi:nitroreductase
MKKLSNFLFRIKQALAFHRQGYLDYKRYASAAQTGFHSRQHQREHLESDIIRQYHILEKGLSMPEFRPRFGKDVVRSVVGLVKQYEALPDDQEHSVYVLCARSALKSYYLRHRELGVEISDILNPSDISNFNEIDPSQAGAKPYPFIAEDKRGVFLDVLKARTSLRSFEMDRIPSREIIERAIGYAIQAPSVCNRQTGRVYAFEGEKAQEVLRLQNGNRGFGHQVPVVLVVASDMRYFVGSIERYQSWIDGGIFGMNLLLALHGLGLGAVPLNWSVTAERDEELRIAAKIAPHDRIIMLIGCGYPRKDALVTVSPRRQSSEVISWSS